MYGWVTSGDTKEQVVAKVKALEPSLKTKGDAINTAYAVVTKDAAAVDGLKTLKTSIETKTADYGTARKNLEAPAGDNLAARLLAADKELEKAYEVLGTAKTSADTASENFNKAVADVATRNATIDAVNAGTIMVKSVEADGSYKLSNNTFLKDGKFYQDGQQLFTNAGGTKQNDLSFTDDTGNRVVYDSSAGRTMSTSDVKQAFARDFGFDVDDATAAAFVGKQYGTVDHKLYEDVVDNKITTAHTALTGKTLSAEDLSLIKNSTGSAIKNEDGAAVKLTDKQLNDLVAKQLIFEGGDFNTKQDAARAAKLAGYTQFEYDNSVYTMTNAGPTEKDVFQAVINDAPNKKEAFRLARSLMGADKVFDYKGDSFTTSYWKPTAQSDQQVLGDGTANTNRAGTRVGLPVTTTEGLSYLTDQEKSVNQRIKEAYEGSTLSKIVGTPDDAMRTLIKMKDVALSPGQGW